MNCIKPHVPHCEYRLNGDIGQCVAPLCQKSIDDILDGLNQIVAKLSHIGTSCAQPVPVQPDDFTTPKPRRGRPPKGE